MININKPKISDDKIIGGKLKNGIKYILINNKNLERTFVTISINVGSFHNPKEYDGLAHFLEHMLFLGSKKYPKSDYFMEQVNKYGGMTNAYTADLNTTYYFNALDNGIEELLDIFSRFFIDPLFDKKYVNKEINAVNNEHLKNINNDYWCQEQLLSYLFDENSNVNNFSTGSNNTLKKKDILEKLKEFYNNYYTTDNISICIASSKSIDKLYKIVENTFGNIKESKSKSLTIVKPFLTKNRNKIYFLQSFSKIFMVRFAWEIPFINSDNIDIIILLDKLMNDRTNHSLYFYLKNKGYLEELFINFDRYGLLNIKLKLTEHGFKNIDFIISFIFKYIDNLFNSDFNNIAKNYKKLQEFLFDNNKINDIQELCNILSENHFNYNTKHVYDYDIIQNIKNDSYYRKYKDYFKKENCLIIISSQKYKNYDNLIKMRETNSYYCLVKNINLIDINEEIILNNLLFNEFMNIKPEYNNKIKQMEPILINKKQWYGGLSNYKPYVYITLFFNNIDYFSTSKNYLLTNISTIIYNFLLESYLSELYEFNNYILVKPSDNYLGIMIQLGIYNDFNIIKLIINKLNDFIKNIDIYFNNLSKKYIDNLLIQIYNDVNNNKFSTPSSYLYNNFDVLINKYNYKDEELIKTIIKIDYNNIKNYISNLFNDKCSLTSLIYGDINKSHANNISIEINNLFKNMTKNKLYLMNKPLEIKDTIIKHPNPIEESNCVMFNFKIGEYTPKNYVILQILNLILSQQFFNSLRTEQQLGYIVNLKIYLYLNNYYIQEIIQSDKKVDLVIEKIEEFNDDIINIIKNIDLNLYINNVKNIINEPLYTLHEYNDHYLNEILNRQFMFVKKKLLLTQLKKITLKEIIDFAKKFINSNNCIKIIVKS